MGIVFPFVMLTEEMTEIINVSRITQPVRTIIRFSKYVSR